MVSCGAQEEPADTGADDGAFFVGHFFRGKSILLESKFGDIPSTLNKIEFCSCASFLPRNRRFSSWLVLTPFPFCRHALPVSIATSAESPPISGPR